MSEQAGTHSVPLGGGAADGPERPPELATHSAAVPFETSGYSERSRRGWKPWAIVGVAIAVPAAVAAALVVTLGGGGDATPAQQAAPTVAAPTPIVEQVATPPSVAAPQRATPVAPARPAATAAAATAQPATSAAAAPDRASSAAETTTQAASTAVAATAATQLATPEERLGAWPEMVQVTIVEGDSLWALAYEYETTVEAISMLNAIADPSELAVGDSVMIPVGFAETLTPAEAVVVEESSASGGEAAEAAATQFAVVPAADTPLSEWPNTVEWTLQLGDSLSSLAITFETTPEAIMTLNAIEDANLVFAGSTIVIPVGYSGAAGEGESATEPETTTQSAATTTESTATQTATTTSKPSSESTAETTTQSAVTTTESTTTTTQQAATVNPASLDDSNEGATTTTQSASLGDGSEATDGDYLEGDAVTTTTATTAQGGTASDDGDYLEGDAVTTTTAQGASGGDGGDYLEE